MMSILRPQRSRDDSGSALVATVGVAMIAIAFSVIVVRQAIMVTNDAARDRVRTVEIHAAEAALDSALSTLERTTPCISVMTVGTGTTAVSVTVNYAYYDGTNAAPLPCTNGVITGKPVQAVVTSVAVPVNPTASGITPERRIQATVNLIPIKVEATGAAIFSAGALTFQNNGSVVPLDPNKRAQIWVENSSYSSASNAVLDGDLIVTDGSVTLSNTSRVTGSVWAKTGFTSGNPISPFKVTGSVVVYSGNMTNSNTPKYGSTVSVSGSITGSYTANGAVCYGSGAAKCGVLPLYVKRGLPVVTYDMQDWIDAGFVPKTKNAALNSFATDVIAGVPLTGSDATNFRANPCVFGNAFNKPIVFTPDNSVYDLTTCNFDAQNSVTFSLKADAAFFVNSLDAKNNFNIQSADGLAHNVWFIIPTNATGTKAFTLKNNASIIAPMQAFIFTPGAFTMKNNTGWRGQIYGGSITFQNNIDIKYAAIGIPGVDLGSGAAPPTTAGFSVEIVNKKEIHN